MAQVPTYQAGVTMAPGSGFRASRAVQPGTGQAAIGESLQAAGAALNDYAINQQVKINQITTANATAAAAESLTQVQNQALARMGANALATAATKDKPATLSASQQFQQAAQQSYKDTLDNLDNDVQRQKFQEWYNSTVPMMNAAVMKHENEQVSIAHKASQEGLLATTSDAFRSAILMGNYNQASAAMRSGMSLSNDMGTAQGLPEEANKQNEKVWVYKQIDGTVDQLLTDQRPDDAQKMVDYYKAHLPADLVDSLSAKIKPQITKIDAKTNVETWAADPEYQNPDGTLNVPKLHEKVKTFYETKTEKRFHPGTPGTSSDPYFSEAIRVGKELNIPPEIIYAQWWNESGGFNSQLAKENFNMSGLTQTTPNGEANKQPDGGIYYRQYGSVKEFADDYINFIKENDPSAVGQQTPEGFVTALKSHGYFTGDLDTYISNVKSRTEEARNIATTGGTAAYTEDVIVPDFAGEQTAMAYVDQVAQDYAIRHKQNLEAASNTFYQALNSGQISNVSELNAYVAGMPISETEKAGFLAKGMAKFGQQRTLNSWAQEDSLQAAYRDLRVGNITTKAELDANYAGRISEQSLAQLERAFTGDTKWANSANIAALDDIVKQNKLNGTERGRIMEQLNAAAVAKAEQGGTITVDDVVDIANKGSIKIVLQKNTFAPDEKVNAVDIPAGISRGDDGAYYTADGVPVTYNDATRQWERVE